MPFLDEGGRLYYTAQLTDRQTIDVYIEDSFGKVQQLIFAFNNKKLFVEPNEQSQIEIRDFELCRGEKRSVENEGRVEQKERWLNGCLHFVCFA